MTDAEFMLEYVAQRHAEYEMHKIEVKGLRKAELDALKALAEMPDKLENAIDEIPQGWSHVEDIRIEIEEALRKFRAAMEGKG